MSEEIWEKVWAKNLVISDYSLKYLDFINTLKTDLQHDSKILESRMRYRPDSCPVL